MTIKIDTWRLFVGNILETCVVYLLWTSKQSFEIINNILMLTGSIWITEAKMYFKKLLNTEPTSGSFFS